MGGGGGGGGGKVPVSLKGVGVQAWHLLATVNSEIYHYLLHHMLHAHAHVHFEHRP